jgi:hypothetical protein
VRNGAHGDIRGIGLDPRNGGNAAAVLSAARNLEVDTSAVRIRLAVPSEELEAYPALALPQGEYYSSNSEVAR